MQCSSLEPGLPSAMLYSAAPRSLSARDTVPVETTLPGFSVVLEKAENAPTAARAPTNPRTTIVRRAFLVFVMGVPLLQGGIETVKLRRVSTCQPPL
jgi:hypothetical protein